jgi:hypothetical protein
MFLGNRFCISHGIGNGWKKKRFKESEDLSSKRTVLGF